MKEHEMGRARSKNGYYRNACKISVRDLEVKRLLGRPRCCWTVNINRGARWNGVIWGWILWLRLKTDPVLRVLQTFGNFLSDSDIEGPWRRSQLPGKKHLLKYNLITGLFEKIKISPTSIRRSENKKKWRLLGCHAVWRLKEPTFRRNLGLPSSEWQESVN
jgi:hypothetical protein